MTQTLEVREGTAAQWKAAARVEEIVGEGFDVKKFVSNFEVLVEASGGVRRLRSLILKFGLAGRLDTNRPQEPKPTLSPSETLAVAAPHPNWTVCRLPDVAEVEMGNSPPGTTYNERGEGTPLINGPVEFSPGHFGRTRRTKFTTSPARMCREGDLLVCVRGATTGRTNIADFDACIGRGVALVRARQNQEFINYFMWSVGNDLLAAGTGTTFPAISRDDLEALIIRLPPLAEQKRIVAKVDQLMALCDELEERQTKKREVGTRLTKSALEALTTAEGPEEFDAAWRRVVENFDVVVDRAEKVEGLRRTVLELAVRGRIVPPSRSAAEVEALLRTVKTQRESLSEGKRKGGRGHGDDAEAEAAPKPYEVPAGWRWCSLADVAGHIVDGTHHTPRYVERGMDFISAKDIRNGKITFEGCKQITKEEFDDLTKRCRPTRGDVLVTKSGSIGEVALVDTDRQFTLFESVALVPVVPAMNSRYAGYVIFLGASGQFGAENQRGVAVRHLHLVDLRRLPFPVPPRKEQDAIVAKVEQLMKVCDQLEERLRRAEDRASKLVEAVVQELVA